MVWYTYGTYMGVFSLAGRDDTIIRHLLHAAATRVCPPCGGGGIAETATTGCGAGTHLLNYYKVRRCAECGKRVYKVIKSGTSG